ncbi:1151_t:CDS:1, partial [Cetraspora pellucida]
LVHVSDTKNKDCPFCTEDYASDESGIYYIPSYPFQGIYDPQIR